MKAIVLCLAACTLLSSSAIGQRSSELVHRNCSWCHTSASPPVKVITAAATPEHGIKIPRVKITKASAPVCLSCHDGFTAQALDQAHINHAPTDKHGGLDCLVCHDPHDRTRSYRMLRGRNGPETAQTAVLGFCRECHTDY